MMLHNTIAQLRTLKLDGLAAGLEEQLAQASMSTLSFEERLALLVDRETHHRNGRKLVRLLQQALSKYGPATIDDIDTRPTRGADRWAVMSLVLGDWVESGHSGLITGATGSGNVVGLCIGAIRLSARQVGALPTCAAVAGRVAHPPRQRP